MAATINTDTKSGPASYATGGFEIATGLSSVAFIDLQLIDPGANLPAHRFEITYNSPSAGSALVKIMVESYQKLPSTLGAVSGLPGGVTARATSGGTYDTTSHTHAIDHNHPATAASAGPTGQNAATLAVALQPNVTTHTHTLDLPNFVANSVAETAHTHTWNSLYQHQHTLTNTETNVALAELTAGTDISGASWNWLAGDA